MQACCCFTSPPKMLFWERKAAGSHPPCSLIPVLNTSECGFTEKGGKGISKAPALFPRKILLAFSVLSAETPGLCCRDKAPVCASLPVPSPPLGSPHQAAVLQPLKGTRALEHRAHCALPSAGPAPAHTWEPQPSQGGPA